jgi:hypothetical protein
VKSHRFGFDQIEVKRKEKRRRDNIDNPSRSHDSAETSTRVCEPKKLETETKLEDETILRS